MFLFACIRLSLSNIEIYVSCFHKKNKNKKYVLARIFGFNNHFIKVTRTWLIFQNFQKTTLFYFNIRGYELVRTMYF